LALAMRASRDAVASDTWLSAAFTERRMLARFLPASSERLRDDSMRFF
jgi:hypothetical protein